MRLYDLVLAPFFSLLAFFFPYHDDITVSCDVLGVTCVIVYRLFHHFLIITLYHLPQDPPGISITIVDHL